MTTEQIPQTVVFGSQSERRHPPPGNRALLMTAARAKFGISVDLAGILKICRPRLACDIFRTILPSTIHFPLDIPARRYNWG